MRKKMLSNQSWSWDRLMPLFFIKNNVTILVSSYQSNVVMAFGINSSGDITAYITPMGRTMGMGRHKDRLYISSNGQLVVHKSSGPEEDNRFGHFTDNYHSQYAFCGGDVDIHDVCPTENEVYYVSALFNCVVMPSLTKTFEVYWVPPWISTDDDGKLKGEDRCHLNGLCCVDGKPRYVTSSSRGDVLGHWRTHKSEGVVYDIVENKIVCEDVYSPHSPRWYNGKLWLLESGTGQFGHVDIENKEFVPKVFLPGFLRGLTFYGNYAIIGLSMERRENAFVDLPLHEELLSQGMEPTCGFRVINMKDFSVECELNISPNIGVSEIYDIVCLPGYRSRVLQTGSQDSFKTYDAVFDPKKIKKNDVISSDIFDTTTQRDPVKYIKPDIEELKKELSEVEGFEDIDNMLNEDLEKSQSNLGQMHVVRKMNKLKKENEEKKKKKIEKEMDEDPYFSSNDADAVFEPVDLSKLLSD